MTSGSAPRIVAMAEREDGGQRAERQRKLQPMKAHGRQSALPRARAQGRAGENGNGELILRVACPLDGDVVRLSVLPRLGQRPDVAALFAAEVIDDRCLAGCFQLVACRVFAMRTDDQWGRRLTSANRWM